MADEYIDYIEDHQPYTSVDVDEVHSGYRKNNWIGCHYFIRDPFSQTEDTPHAGPWKCMATNVKISGLGKKNISGDGIFIWDPLDGSDITGYCAGDCDGEGLGRGCSNGSVEELLKLPITCNYYRPWAMGFGAEKPHPLYPAGNKKKAYSLATVPLKKRLPLSFEVYNLRGAFQRCQFWNYDTAATFTLDSEDTGGVSLPSAIFSGQTSLGCTSSNVDARKYADLMDYEGDINDSVFGKVWSQANTVVCNGAKPECPCYTGKWTYCTDRKLIDGMPVSAQQIMELRYWAGDWTETSYDNFFSDLHNTAGKDITDSAIYTYTGYGHQSTNPMDAVIKGTKVELCFPLPAGNKEFDPETSLKIEDVTYDGNYLIGDTPKEGEAIFPTLLRSLQITFNDFKPLNVVYPYANDGPFSLDGLSCDEKQKNIKPYVKKTWFVDGDQIYVFGSTVPNIKVYAFNLLHMPSAPSFIYTHSHYLNIPSNELSSFYEECNNWLGEVGDTSKDDEINSSEETAWSVILDTLAYDDGFFYLGPIPLNYEEVPLVVLVDFGDGTYGFVRRSVHSVFMSGAIAQSKFQNTYDAGTTEEEEEDSSQQGCDGASGTYYLDTLPEIFTGSVELAGKSIPLYTKNAASAKAELLTTARVHSHKSVTNYSTKQTYSYAIVKVTKESQQTKWAGIPGTNKIWCEVSVEGDGTWQDQLNGVFNHGFISARIESAGGTACNEEVDEDAIDLNFIFPTAYGADTETGIEQLYIEPNACVLEPQDSNIKTEFRDSEWTLTIKYWYHTISFDAKEESESSDANREIIFPVGDDVEYVSSPDDLESTETGFEITPTTQSTMKVLSFFGDDKGMLVGASATKLLMDVAINKCRSIEINYRWGGTGDTETLEPSSGMSALGKGKFSASKDGTEGANSTPPCGDHDLNPVTQVGPMWFPFSACARIQQYQEFALAQFCTMPIEGRTYTDSDGNSQSIICEGKTQHWRPDYRFKGPNASTAWASNRGGTLWLQACNPTWNYHYLTVDDTYFTGWARIRAGQTLTLANLTGSSPAPFGDVTREYLEWWYSQDYFGHLSYEGQQPAGKNQWMPVAMDNEMFGSTFNAFENSSLHDAFSISNQVNYHMNTDLSEHSTPRRYTFGQVFEVVRKGTCSYPEPAVQIPPEDTESEPNPDRPYYVHYYKFLQEDTLWAWQEHWKPIARNNAGDEQVETDDGEIIEQPAETTNKRLNFVNLSYPDYIFDYFKEEHRISCAEGTYRLIYEGPKFDEDTGEMSQYPSISIDGQHKKHFGIFYSDYDSDSSVDWYVESETGQVDGSGGDEEEEPSKYEQIENGDLGAFIHHPDMLLCPGAFSGDEKSLVYPEDGASLDELDATRKVSYENFLIASIGISNLKYLPYDTDLGGSLGSNYNTAEDTLINTSFSDNEKSIYTIIIKGQWGISGKERFCKPGVQLVLTYQNSDTYAYNSSAISSTTTFKTGATDSLEYYEIKIFIPFDPIKTTLNKVEQISITLSAAAATEKYRVDGITYTTAELTERIEEDIFVYERKYIISKGSFGENKVNMTGPQHPLLHQQDFDYSGQYFPSRGAYPAAFEGISKIRGVKALSEQEDNIIELEVDKESLPTVEAEDQKGLYNTSLNLDNDSVKTTQVGLDLILAGNDILFQMNQRNFGSAEFIHSLIPWDSHYLVADFIPATFWQPAGHKFVWSDKYSTKYCWMPSGPSEDVIDGEYMHLHGDWADEIVDPYRSLYWLRGVYSSSAVLIDKPANAGAVNSGLNAVGYG